uniref:Uncharacterized protein n=1 Tax=viral metagenome TaxID=1070528 RepID=A0A6C0LBR3_9ZZZZ
MLQVIIYYRKPTASLSQAYRKPIASLSQAYRKPTASPQPKAKKSYK